MHKIISQIKERRLQFYLIAESVLQHKGTYNLVTSNRFYCGILNCLIIVKKIACRAWRQSGDICEIEKPDFWQKSLSRNKNCNEVK